MANGCYCIDLWDEIAKNSTSNVSSQHSERNDNIIYIAGYTVHVFKKDACLRKPFPLLIRFSDTGEASENLNAAPEEAF